MKWRRYRQSLEGICACLPEVGGGEGWAKNEPCLKRKKKKTGTNMSVYIVGGGVGRKNPLERLKTERNLC